jgi:hypothetical protein
MEKSNLGKCTGDATEEGGEMQVRNSAIGIVTIRYVNG